MKNIAKDFKMTELGPIPKDWEVKRLGEIGEPLMCKRVLKSQTADSGDVPFYKIGTFGGQADSFISRELFDSFRRQYSYPKQGDVLISAAGTIGRSVVFDGRDAYFQDSNIVWIGNDETIVTNEYLRWSYETIKWYTEDGGTVSRLYNNNLRETLILVPPLPEQRKIAAALSDVDEMIAALEKLIEKKRKIKTGAMQRLLTGKTRLPGFKGAWVEKRLGGGGEWIGGGTPSTQNAEYWNGRIPWVSSSDLEEGNIYHINKTRFISESAVRNSATSKCPQGALLIIARVGVGKVAIADTELCTSQDFSNLMVGDKTDVRFLAYLLSVVMARMKEATQGTSIKGVSLEDLKALVMILPPTLAEQKAIAKVLGDMDEEIAALEAELAKTRQLKQGMMQELLTGRVRLVEVVSRGERRERGGCE